MRLTNFSDYALRILIYVATKPEQNATIAGISKAYGISRNHLMKITNTLGAAGFLTTTRGAGGGLRLARPSHDISVGAVLRHTEAQSDLVECADRTTNSCVIAPACALKHELFHALEAFYARLDGVSLADITQNAPTLAKIFDRETARAA